MKTSRVPARPLLPLVLLAAGVVGCSLERREAVLDFFFDRDLRAISRVDSSSGVASGGSKGLAQAPTLKQHVPYAKGECLVCHGNSRFTGSRDNSVSVSMVNPGSMKTAAIACLKCHTKASEVTARGVVAPEGVWAHGPAAVGACAECHEPHEGTNRNLLRSPRSEPLCLKCHQNQPRTEAMRNLDCVECHDPHKSRVAGEPFLKESEPGGLCLSCHEKVRQDATRPWIHAPVTMGLCDRCHSPHDGDARSIRRPLRDACLSCHSQMEPRPEHQPEKGDCDRCHDPHAAASSSDLFLRKDVR